jgi:integrase
MKSVHILAIPNINGQGRSIRKETSASFTERHSTLPTYFERFLTMTKKIGLYKDRKQWRVRWFGRYDPGTGKTKRYSKLFERKVDAEKFQEKVKAEFGQGVERDPSNETLKSYAETWLRRKTKIENIRPATVLLYKGTFERLYGFFGSDRLLRSISRNDVKDFLAGLKPKAKRIEPLSDWAKHRVMRQCKTLFSEIVKDGIISVNPFTDIKMRCGLPSEWYYLKPVEFHKLLDVTPTLREKVLYCLAYTAGLRESEILSLFWTNIDFDKGMVRIVNRPATENLPGFYIKDDDAREIPLPKFTLDLLTKLQLESPEGVPFVLMDEQRCQRIRDKWEQCREQGKDWFNRNLANNTITNFHRRVKQGGIEASGKKLTVHVLRKCCIQNWANILPMNVVKELAGHSDIETTNRFYSTVDEEHLKAAAQLGDKLLATDLKLTFSTNSEQKQEA